MLKDFILFTVTNTTTLLLTVVLLLVALLLHDFMWSSLLIVGALMLDTVIYNLVQKEEKESPKPFNCRFKGTLKNKGGFKK